MEQKRLSMSSFHRKVYGLWAGNPRGTPADPTQCCEIVWDGFGHRQCSRPRGYGPEQAYCKQHDPEAVATRAKASGAKRDIAFYRRMLEVSGPAAIRCLEEIANGHNDPQAKAREFLETIKKYLPALGKKE